MDFLASSLAGPGLAVESRSLASPLTCASPGREVPAELAERLGRPEFSDYFHSRSLFNQFVMFSDRDEPAELFVFNLFHESEPLFAHKEDGHLFFIDPLAWDLDPGLERWMKEKCHGVKPNPAAYLKRFTRMVEAVRQARPGTPILVLTRLSHYPAFGPNPFSYLQGWDQLWAESIPILEGWAREIPGLHILNMDRILAGIWRRGENRIDPHCPFLRLKERPGPDGRVLLEPRRDMEHVGSVWPVLAERIAEFLDTGEIKYRRDEIPPREWGSPYPGPERLTRTEIKRILESGGNYGWARVAGSLLFHPEAAKIRLMAEMGGLAPVCQNLLHMLKWLARLNPGPDPVRLVKTHLPRAEAFTKLGELYRRKYLQKISEIIGPGAPTASNRQGAAQHL